ncbi:hypothetical protein H2200_013610 [Cladophialophora chaetospira]|uniref:Uncharacterized protein n=1 Tax=Cladophialophora chaetospira TaxID=386627 RepID=A0AA38TX59_9EURO|nr:hypothetical protein H2200_013610 [Cladophialophora chaetospira]
MRQEDGNTQYTDAGGNYQAPEEAEKPIQQGRIDASYLVRPDMQRSNNGLLMVSKQISEETIDLLYGENIFEVGLHGGGESVFQVNISKRNRRRMRRIIAVARPPGSLVPPGWKPDQVLWRSTLPNLTSSRLVALEPTADMDQSKIYTFDEEMDMWLM